MRYDATKWIKSIIASSILAISSAGLSSSAFATVVPMPSTVTAYSPLTTKQMSVSKAYIALFGRSPDLGGLNYWTTTNNGLSESATVSEAVNFIAKKMAGSNIAPISQIVDQSGNFISGVRSTCDTTIVTGWDEFVEYAYAFVLGKAAEDDMSGVNYWQCQVRSGVYTTPGDLINAIMTAANGATGASADKFKNRMTMLEAASRLQLGRSRSLGYQDSQTIIRRVTDTANSFNDAFTVLNQLTNGSASAAGPRWETAASGTYTPSKIFGESAPLSGGGYVHKYVVWYNRSGRMLLAHIFLPPNYSTTGTFPAIISVHGGGWRDGFIEKTQKYNTAFTQSSGQYIVLSPEYSLTSLSYASPEQQNDIDDFITLVKSPATMNAFRVDTSRVNFFGLSAGGHLLNLIGSTKDLGKIATIYPESNLNASANTSLLMPYINAYLNGAPANPVSPTYVWTVARSTKFFIQHGDADPLVPIADSINFTNTVGTNFSKLCAVPNAAHGYYAEYASGYQTIFDKVQSKVVSFFNSGSFPDCTY